ncbi:DinB family protein [Ectobacillus sp. JY-23]|uniref:DinB family protein n=1 Tax=Ectobacillus sp. JY-23 TaxID=2933872 RepID=UPI001FF69D10|nr:DinB family protein [Ectobacillus sp. JY-23]UOY92982.1 DinB family protein [Ectobacillus sp. JY-23]
MENLLFTHMKTVRTITENLMEKIPESLADSVPEGFNNSIRWNLGHILFVQERLVFGAAGEILQVPLQYERLFAAGTKPADWQETPPSFAQLLTESKLQQERIQTFIPERLEARLPGPFTNRSGMTFHTIGETFLFSFYHEALHVETIKRLYRTIQERND